MRPYEWKTKWVGRRRKALTLAALLPGTTALAALLLAGPALPAPAPAPGLEAAAPQEPPALPDEVREWLEADQVRRWAGLLERGGELFASGSCVRCHGEGGSGGRWGPDLTDDEWVQSSGDLAGIQDTIFWGVRRRDLSDPDRPFMTPAGSMDLEWADLQALAAYVWSLSNGTFLPG